jgi:hypothetical protein
MMSCQQPTAVPVIDWQGRKRLESNTLIGRTCLVVPFDLQAHAGRLFDTFRPDQDGRGWTYYSYGPFTTYTAFEAWLKRCESTSETLFHTVLDPAGLPVGLVSFLRSSSGRSRTNSGLAAV